MATFRKRSGRWTAEVRRKGVYCTKTFANKAYAVEWARQFEAEIDSGIQGRRENATLEDAFKKFSEEVAPKRRGERWDKTRLKKLCRDPLAAVSFKDLAASHIADYRDRRLEKVAPSTVNRELNLISSVITRAMKEWGWINRHPVHDIERPENPKHRDRRISEREIERICWALDFDGETVTETSHKVAVAFLLAIETAMRQGEIANLRPADLRLDDRYVIIRDSKNKDARHVALTAEAERLLRLLPANDTGYVLGVKAGNISSTFRKARKHCGIEDLKFHDSRHEAMTRLARKLELLDLCRHAGARDPRTVMIYYNPTATEIAGRLD